MIKDFNSVAANGDELTVAELYKRTSQEVDSLKDRLGNHLSP